MRAQWIERRRASGESATYVALIGGNRLAAEHRWEEAAAAYEAVRRDHPDDPQVKYRIAALQFARGETERAAPAFAALADSKAPDWIKAQALLHLGRNEEALRLLEPLARDNPDFSALQRELGVALAMSGRNGEAEDHLRRAVSLQPQDAGAQVVLGSFLAREGRFAEAIDHLEAALRIDPTLESARQLLESARRDASRP